MQNHPSIIITFLMALVAPAPAAETKPDATAELKAVSAPYHGAVETVSADYQKWVASMETWYSAELDKLQAARAKLGDLDGAVAIKAERARMASHFPTTPEQIQAMPAPLRTLRTSYDQGLKKSADEGARRMDVARRKYLADLEALQKRITISGDIDQALLVKAEKERFIAELAEAAPKTALPQPAAPAATGVKPPVAGPRASGMPPPTMRIDSVGATIVSLRFFAVAGEGPPPEGRVFATKFPKSEARRVFWQIDLVAPRRENAEAFAIEAIWHRPDGSVLATQGFAGRIAPGWNKSFHYSGRRAQDGNWEPGTYSVELFAGKEKIAAGTIEIVDG